MFKTSEKITNGDFDLYELNRQLDITKSKVFMGKNAAFLGPLMSMMSFVWSEELPTAATNGIQFWWNPHWFLELDPEVRKTVLIHELWHVARLHIMRYGDRNRRVFNYALDVRINNDLDKEKYSFHGTKPWLDHSFDKNGRAVEEDIYDQLMARGEGWIEDFMKMLGDSWKGVREMDENGEPIIGDLVESDSPEQSKEDLAQIIGNVVQAAHQARISGHGSDVPGDIETLLKQFLAPVVPWEVLLHKFFHELIEEDYSWARPNRRFADIYLPSRTEDEGAMDHLIYYLDVSGSVTDSQVIRFNSEVKYIKDTFKPKKLTLVQFDTRISAEKTFLEEDDFVELVVIGRGGTMWGCVRDHIDEHKPTAAIVFTDMGFFDKVDEPVHKTPTIFVDVSNSKCPAPYTGSEIIHIRG